MNKIILALCVLIFAGCSVSVQSTSSKNNSEFEYYMTCYSGGVEIIPRVNIESSFYMANYATVTVKGTKRIIRTNADCVIEEIEKVYQNPTNIHHITIDKL